MLLELTDGAVVDMKNYGVSPEFNIEAVEQNSSVVKVKFVETNQSEGVKPFAYCGDNGGDYKVCPTLSFGTITVTAEGIDNSGDTIGQVQVTFQIVDTTPSSPSPTTAPLAPASVPRWIETDPDANIDERHESCFVMVDNAVVGRRAYLVGGRGNKALDILDPVTRTWSVGLEPPIQMHHMQCVAAQGLLWVVSPWTDWYPKESNVDVIYVYDPATNTWSTKPGMPPSRQRGGAAVIVSDDESKIYVSHGNNGGHETKGSNHAESLGYLDEFDISTETWTVLSSNAPNPRDHTGGAMVNGRICVAGGRNGGLVNWPEIAPTDCYDLSSGTWSVEAPIPQVRGGSAYGQTCDGKLMVAGGEGSGKAWDNVDVFDGTSWTTIESLNIGRHGTGLAFDCVCDHIIIASGAAAQGGGPEITSVETYVPAGVNPRCLA